MVSFSFPIFFEKNIPWSIKLWVIHDSGLNNILVFCIGFLYVHYWTLSKRKLTYRSSFTIRFGELSIWTNIEDWKSKNCSNDNFITICESIEITFSQWIIKNGSPKKGNAFLDYTSKIKHIWTVLQPYPWIIFFFQLEIFPMEHKNLILSSIKAALWRIIVGLKPWTCPRSSSGSRKFTVYYSLTVTKCCKS